MHARKHPLAYRTDEPLTGGASEAWRHEALRELAPYAAEMHAEAISPAISPHWTHAEAGGAASARGERHGAMHAAQTELPPIA